MLMVVVVVVMNIDKLDYFRRPRTNLSVGGVARNEEEKERAVRSKKKTKRKEGRGAGSRKQETG